MTHVIGIDPGSSRCSYAVFDPAHGELLAYRSVEVKAEPNKRPYEIAEAVWQDLTSLHINPAAPVFYIEQPFGFNISGVAAVERTIGGLLYLLNPQAELINVNTWKKACQVMPPPRDKRRSDNVRKRIEDAQAAAGEGIVKITSKTMIKARCLELFPEIPEDVRPPDVYDAVLIGYAGYLINSGEYVE